MSCYHHHPSFLPIFCYPIDNIMILFFNFLNAQGALRRGLQGSPTQEDTGAVSTPSPNHSDHVTAIL